jgi:uncharacterized protein
MDAKKSGWMAALMLVVGVMITMSFLTHRVEAAPGLQTAPTGRTITVVGDGTAKIQPDMVEAVVGVEIVAPTPAGAVEQARLQTEAIVAALVDQGLTAEAIQRVDFNLQVRQPLSESGETTPQYMASQKLQLTIKDLGQVESVLLKAIDAGANQIEQVNFKASDNSAAITEARQKAITNAQNHADALAVLTGVKIGALYQINESITAMPNSPEVRVQVQVTYTIE